MSLNTAGVAVAETPYIGIIDPFLTKRARRGERVFLLLYPNTVKGMRHAWSHASFSDELAQSTSPVKETSVAEAWLREFASQWNIPYDEMVVEASSRGGYLTARGVDIHSWSEISSGEQRLFWEHLETVTGRRFDGDHRSDVGFSCSC